MSLLTCHAFSLAQEANSTNTCLAMKNSQPCISQIPWWHYLQTGKAKVTAKAAVNQMCLKHSIFLLGNRTHLLCFPQGKGYLAHLLLKQRTPDTQIYLRPTCDIGPWLWSINPLSLQTAQRQSLSSARCIRQLQEKIWKALKQHFPNCSTWYS